MKWVPEEGLKFFWTLVNGYEIIEVELRLNYFFARPL